MSDGNRYSSAWLEHSTRIAQRQNVVQIYIAATGAMYGFFLSKSPPEPSVYQFILCGVTLLTIVCSAFLWSHHRVMQHLLIFMKNCELRAADHMKSSGNEYLFYFGNSTNKKVDRFHARQRLIHRIVLSSILAADNIAAIALCWDNIDLKWSITAIVILVVVLGWPYFDLPRDSDELVESRPRKLLAKFRRLKNFIIQNQCLNNKD